MPNPLIYYVRHGQTDWNAEFRFQGQQDIPLNELGRKQAERNGKVLNNLLAENLKIPFVASPLKRTRETMEIILSILGRDKGSFEIEPDIIEACYGDWEGQTLASVKTEYPELHRFRKKNRWTFSPPGGESHQMLEERVSAWHNSLQEDCVVVAHGVVGRVLRYLLLDIDPQKAGEFTFPQDKICVIQKGKETFV